MAQNENSDDDVEYGLKIYNKMVNTKVCQRCKKPTREKCLSLLNNEIICLECKEKEMKFPEYKVTQNQICDEAKSLKKQKKGSNGK